MMFSFYIIYNFSILKICLSYFTFFTQHINSFHNLNIVIII